MIGSLNVESSKDAENNNAKASRKTSSAYQHIDGLRGIGAFCVYNCHFVELFLEAPEHKEAQNSWAWVWILRTPLRILVEGPFWVLIFFIISGFVLPLRYFETGKGPNLCLRVLKRYFRLMLPLFGIITMYWTYIRLGLMYFDAISNSQFKNVKTKDYSRLWLDGLVLCFVNN